LMPAADAERALGIECYATAGGPCTASAKSSAEDFLVEERLLEGEVSPKARPGYLPLYRVEKRSIDTMHMADQMSAALRSKVSYGGLKDKRAIAIQYLTPTSRRSDCPMEVIRENFVAHLVGYVPRPLTRAALAGNRFTVVLRDCCAEIGPRIVETMSFAQTSRLPNFYGLQRFGSSGAGTHLVGKALVGKDFEGAAKLMLLADYLPDIASGRAATEAMAAGRYAEGISLLPPGRDVEKLVALELSRHPGAWVRALRAVPVRLRRLYVQAYQSWIFNRTLSGAVRGCEEISRAQNGDNWATVSEGGLVTSTVHGVRESPVVGAVPMVQLVGYSYRDYGSRFDSYIKETLQLEGVRPGDFYIKEMQELSAEGGFRRPHLAVGDASWKVQGQTATLVFTLAKGQYATVLLREIIKPRDPAGSGLA
jgi:tRNA pseudouridine13 synthase